MAKNSPLIKNNENGAVLIWVVCGMVMLLGMVALAIDVSHLVVARNELKNAADAGSLAAAQNLYNDNGSAFNEEFDDVGIAAATANKSENVAVEVASIDVERGHWSFGLGTVDRGFTPVSTPELTELWNVSTVALDEDTNFVNAVRVTTHRKDQPVASYFARIFGLDSFVMKARSVAYLGYAGTLLPGEVDQPIGICKQSLLGLSGDKYSCNIGRMLNSGSDTSTHNTGGWTNFTQPCETANPVNLIPLVCGDGNSKLINLGESIGATGGVTSNVLVALMSCWCNCEWKDKKTNAPPSEAMNVKLPVIDCPGNNVSNCAEVLGMVELNIIWINEQGTPKWDETPRIMKAPATDSNGNPIVIAWDDTDIEPILDKNGKVDEEATGQARWKSFVAAFNLRGPEGELLTETGETDLGYMGSTIYFLPDCKMHELKGKTGGENFGVLAKIPVLVD